MSYKNFVKKFTDNKTLAGGIKSRGHIGMSSGSGAGAPSSNPNKGFSPKIYYVQTIKQCHNTQSLHPCRRHSWYWRNLNTYNIIHNVWLLSKNVSYYFSCHVCLAEKWRKEDKSLFEMILGTIIMIMLEE